MRAIDMTANIKSENVIAMELATDNDGKIIPQDKTGWVKPFRQGKVDAINMVIKMGHSFSPMIL